MRAKTKEVKMFQGTYEASRTQGDGVEFELTRYMPVAPSDWPMEAQTIWKQVWGWLKSVNQMAAAYSHTVEEYCWSVYEWRMARIKLQSRPDDDKLHKRLEMYAKNMRGLQTKLGLNPIDSQKLRPRNTEEPDEDNLVV